jgi:hypothetical protein
MRSQLPMHEGLLAASRHKGGPPVRARNHDAALGAIGRDPTVERCADGVTTLAPTVCPVPRVAIHPNPEERPS